MFQELALLTKSPLHVKVLNFFVRQPGVLANAREVASVLGASQTAVAKELIALHKLNILQKRSVSRVPVYRVDERDPWFKPLQTFLEETTTPTDSTIAKAFRGLSGVTRLVIAGLLVGETKSPVDLLLVCKNPKDKRLGKIVKKLEAEAALPLRYAVLGIEEYHERKQAYDRLLRDIYEYGHRTILERGV